jgi:hypothetical protein
MPCDESDSNHRSAQPVMLALALILQSHTRVSNDKVIEAAPIDRRWVLSLNCLQVLVDLPHPRKSVVAIAAMGAALDPHRRSHACCDLCNSLLVICLITARRELHYLVRVTTANPPVQRRGGSGRKLEQREQSEAPGRCRFLRCTNRRRRDAFEKSAN